MSEDAANAPRRSRRGTRRRAVRVLAIVAALGTLALPVAPTGLRATDAVLPALGVALVVLAAARASRWTLLVLGAVATAAASSLAAAVLGGAGLAVAVVLAVRRRHDRVLGALAAALAGPALLRLVDGGFTGGSAGLAAVAVLPVLLSGHRHAPIEARRRVHLALAGAGALAALAVLGFGLAAASARPDADRGADALEAGIAAARAGDVDEAAAELQVAADALGRAADALGAPWALGVRAVPGAGPNASAVASTLRVAADVARQAGDLAASVDLDALVADPGRVDADALGALAPPLAALEEAVAAAQGVLRDERDSAWLVGPVARRLDDAAERIDGGRDDVALAAEAARSLPGLLGGDGSRRYLVLFVTPVEGRATGFPGNFAEILATEGRLEMTRFGRISDLPTPPIDPATIDAPADFLARLVPFGALEQWRSLTLSADFPTVASVAAQVYVAGGGQPVDGVLTVDPTALAGLLRITGPVAVPGVGSLDADTAEDFLFLGQYVGFDETPDRVDALETLSRATFDRLLATRLPPPPELGRILGPLAEVGNLRMATFDDTAAFLASLGIDHPLPPTGSDVLAVTTNNAIGNKMDLFLRRTIGYDVSWDPATGALTASLRIELRNELPPPGLPVGVVGDSLRGVELPPGSNRTYLSVYTPWTLDDVSNDGGPIGVEQATEAGLRVYSMTLDLAPGASTVVELRLSGALAPAATYELGLWNQVVVVPDDVAVTVDVAGTDPLTAAAPATVSGRVVEVREQPEGPRTYRIQTMAAPDG